MYCGVPVIACNSGGPMESVEHDKTGYLISASDTTAQKWSDSMQILF